MYRQSRSVEEPFSAQILGRFGRFTGRRFGIGKERRRSGHNAASISLPHRAISSAWSFASRLPSRGECLGSLQRSSRPLSSQLRAAKLSGHSAAPEDYRAPGVAVTIIFQGDSGSRVPSLPSCSLQALSSSLVALDIGRLVTHSESCDGVVGHLLF
jgi:hypothetical protein